MEMLFKKSTEKRKELATNNKDKMNKPDMYTLKVT